MTSKLPILLSVPHAGLLVPPEAEPFCILTADQIIKDGDEGAAEIYDLHEYVEKFVTSDIARSMIDLNRAEDDWRADGIIKTHTIWNEPVFNQPLPKETIEQLIKRYYQPYHERIDKVDDSVIRLCVDCHTMAEIGPPVGPDIGQPRPHVCLGDLNGRSLPEGWMTILADCCRKSFGESVSINKPFGGGYITQRHSQNRPWVQLELSRADFLPNQEKRVRVLSTLRSFCERVFGAKRP